MDWRLKEFTDQKGVTLLELMVVIAIIVVLLCLGYVDLRRFKANYDLTDATNQLYADLEWVRQKSMGSAHVYGILFSSNGYTIFEDTNDNQSYDGDADTVVKTETFTNITLTGYLSPVIYSRRGTPNASFTLTLTNEYGKTKQIVVSQFKVRIR
ncbi:MAG: GspH/FimT family pseudopilin [Candidatus Desulfofervidaceae bacterium]|nr:GspH/FimT family pseudopilin [Candidatus Desulfofervidaceae bacterium]